MFEWLKKARQRESPGAYRAGLVLFYALLAVLFACVYHGVKGLSVL